MPKHDVTIPAATASTDRLALGAEMVRGDDSASNPTSGCYCSCACFDAEPSTYAAGCAACCCFEMD